MRVFQSMGFGLIVVPGSHYLAQTYKIDTAILTLPILVVVVALVYLSENNAIMRCGRYIKQHIEPNIQGVVGWETWLETRSAYDTRAVDKHISYAFYLLFLVYFVGSVFLAVRFAYSIAGQGYIVGTVLLGFYVAIGVWFLIFLLRSIKVSTSTTADVA
ncbi:MAG: hypothetical protein ACO1PB_19875 [Ramlibacter sp.]